MYAVSVGDRLTCYSLYRAVCTKVFRKHLPLFTLPGVFPQ